MSKLKLHSTYTEQISKLCTRGCIINDNTLCEDILKNIGYYRLSAYFLPFKQFDGTYQHGLLFDKVYHIYEFDRKLRSLLLSTIEVIEVSLRARLAYFHAEKYGALGYIDKSTFNKKHNPQKFTSAINRELELNANLPFVKHYVNNYCGIFPLWVISELFTFGMLSHFYADLTTADKKKFTGEKFRHMVSWLKCCTDLRNMCAHSRRLYYSIFPSTPSGFGISEPAKRRLWGAILVVRELYPSAEQWNIEFIPKITSLFEEHKDDIELRHIGFPDDWKPRLKK